MTSESSSTQKNVSENTALMREWDYEKNNTINPVHCARSSRKKVWWKCKHGHSWQAVVRNRTYGYQGCPYCSGRLAIPGINDLETVLPKLASEWDYDKNNELIPSVMKPNSHKKVWWKCEHGHSWLATVNNRKKGTACPYCSGRVALKGVNDLATLFPKLAVQWDYEKNGKLIPSTITCASNKNVWWKGSCGHTWQTTVYNRIKGHGCPYCSGRYAIIGVNDLETVSPDLVSEWDYNKNGVLKPSELKSYSNRMAWWLCKYGHSWSATISYRSRGHGCPYCAGSLVQKGVNDLETLMPELALEWDYEKNGELKPNEVKSKSSKYAWWQCKYGHSWKAIIYSRSNGSGCPYCKNIAIMTGYNDLATLNPELAIQWDYDKNHPLMPTDVGVNSGHKVWWFCKYGHRWQARVVDRNQGSGCPVCAGKQILANVNDFATSFPKLALEWDYEKNGILLPTDVAPFSSRKVWWKCDKAHSWNASLRNRANGNACPYCSGHLVLQGFNDLATINPDVVYQWDYEKNGTVTPENVTVSSGKIAWWSCSLGHSWQASIAHRSRNKNNDCLYCLGRKVLKGFNDLTTTHPHIAKEWDYEKNDNQLPENFYSGSTAKAWWRCSKGHSWHAQVRTRKKYGCPYCAGNIVEPGVNDLLTLYPNVASWWDSHRNGDLLPQNVTAHSGKKVWWLCDYGHSWQATIASRSDGNGCPYCANQAVLSGYNDFKTLFPEQADEWDYEKNGSISLDSIAAFSMQKFWWKCKLGHSWYSTVSGRSSGSGCPICVGQRPFRSRLVK